MSARILIADDHSIVRAGIKTIVREHALSEKIDEASSENELITFVKSNFYDMILLDINIPGTDFISLMHWLQQTSPDSGIVIFSMYNEEIYGKRCLQLGAKSFLHKSATAAEIVHAFKTVLEGGTYITARLKASLQHKTNGSVTGNPFEHLSSRELEIARLINKGYKLPEICTILNIQYSTANTYKRRIFEKLNVPTAVALAHLMGMFKVTG